MSSSQKKKHYLTRETRLWRDCSVSLPPWPAGAGQAAAVESCPETAALQEVNPVSAGG